MNSCPVTASPFAAKAEDDWTVLPGPQSTSLDHIVFLRKQIPASSKLNCALEKIEKYFRSTFSLQPSDFSLQKLAANELNPLIQEAETIIKKRALSDTDANVKNLIIKIERTVSKLEEPQQDHLLRSIIVWECPNIGEGMKWTRCEAKLKNGEFYLEPVKVLHEPSVNLDLKGFPCQAATSDEYFNMLDKYPGEVCKYPSIYVSDLLSSPALNVPGKLTVQNGLPEGLVLRSQVALDFPRLTLMTLDGKILYDSGAVKYKDKSSEEITIDIFMKCLTGFNYDASLTQNLSKLLTQAAVASPCELLFRRFSNDKLGFHIVSPKSRRIDICSIDPDKNTPLKNLIICQTLNFGLIDIRQPENHIKYIRLKRIITIDRNALKGGLGAASELCDHYSHFADSPEALHSAEKYVKKPDNQAGCVLV